jgi:hypothetical protein
MLGKLVSLTDVVNLLHQHSVSPFIWHNPTTVCFSPRPRLTDRELWDYRVRPGRNPSVGHRMVVHGHPASRRALSPHIHHLRVLRGNRHSPKSRIEQSNRCSRLATLSSKPSLTQSLLTSSTMRHAQPSIPSTACLLTRTTAMTDRG